MKSGNSGQFKQVWQWFKGLWTENFIYWWIISLATVFMFDLFWMGQTTFRPMSYFEFYPFLFLSSLVVALPSLFDKRGYFQLVWLLFFDALFIANLMYCRTYYDAIPLSSYGLMGNLVDFKASVADSFKWYYIWLPILSIAAFIYYQINSRITRRWQNPLPYVSSLVVLGIVAWAGDAWRGGILHNMEFMRNNAYLSSSLPAIYSIGGHLVHDYYKTQKALSPEEEEKVAEWLRIHREITNPYWCNDSIFSARKVPKNLVFLLCESLESWVLNTSVENKELTPHLNLLIKDSTTFFAPNVVTQVGAGRSIDGQLLTLAGLLPMNYGAYAYEANNNYYYTIPKAINESGGKSILLTCDKPYVWNQASVARAFGLDTLIYSKDFDIDETAGPTKRLSDGSFMRQIKEKLEAGDLWNENQRTMIMAVTYSGHNPFHLPEHLRNISLDGDYPQIIKDYMITANYTDESLQILIDYLKSRPDWEETMVVITGDHEGLGSDRKTAMNNSNTKAFVDPGQHTPLIILNAPLPGKYTEELGQVDIYSTLLDLMGFHKYPWRGLGFSIFDPAHPAAAVGMSGRLVGQISETDKEMESQLLEARNVSDLILKFNLLENLSSLMNFKLPQQ